MDYFKEIVEDKLTKEHEGIVLHRNLTKLIEEYTEKGYNEFKIVLIRNPEGQDAQYRLIARGDKENIKKVARKWYPMLIDE